MVKNETTKKRRVAAVRQEEIRLQAASRKARRRRLIVGGTVGFLALALIAPLAAGIISSVGSSDSAVERVTTTTLRDLPWLEPESSGAALVGDTPCPATDGTEVRTTSFETAPPLCIEPDSTHDLVFTTEIGSFTLPIDASLDADAANLAVTFAHYRTYEQVAVQTFFDGGMLWIGGNGDTGFTIPGSFAEGIDPYPVGSVVLASDIGAGRLDGVIIVVLDDAASGFLASDPRHVVIGSIDDLSEVLAVAENPAAALTVPVTTVIATQTS